MSSLIQTIFWEFKFQHSPSSPSTIISNDNFPNPSSSKFLFHFNRDTKTRKYQITYSVIQYWSIFIRCKKEERERRTTEKLSPTNFSTLGKEEDAGEEEKIVYNFVLTISYVRQEKKKTRKTKWNKDNRVKYSPVSNWSVLNKHKLIMSFMFRLDRPARNFLHHKW